MLYSDADGDVVAIEKDHELQVTLGGVCALEMGGGAWEERGLMLFLSVMRDKRGRERVKRKRMRRSSSPFFLFATRGMEFPAHAGLSVLIC